MSCSLCSERIARNAFFSFSEQNINRQISDVIAIGVSHSVSTHELKQIATDSNHILLVRDPGKLDQYLNKLVRLVCN